MHWIVELVEVEGVCFRAVIGHFHLERTGVEIVMDLMHKVGRDIVEGDGLGRATR
jgi:hypothetical protein